MNKYRIARVARNLARQFHEMKVEEDEHLPLLIEDARAQVASVGFTLEQVVAAGLHRLGRVPRAIIDQIAEEREFYVHLGTYDWQSAIEWALSHYSEYMEWHDRTALRKLLLQHELNAYEFVSAEFIIRRAEYHALEADDEWSTGAKEGEDQWPEPSPSDASNGQLGLGI